MHALGLCRKRHGKTSVLTLSQCFLYTAHWEYWTMGFLLQSTAFVCNRVALVEVLPPAQNALARRSSSCCAFQTKWGRRKRLMQ